MIRRPPRSTRTDTLFPYTTLFRSFEGRCQLRSPWLTILLSRKLNFNLHVSRITTNEPSPSKRAAVLPAKIWLPQNKSMHRSEEHTSELQSLMRISYAVFCLKKKKQNNTT